MSKIKLSQGLKTIFVIYGFLISNLTLAIHGDINSAIALRNAIELNSAEHKLLYNIESTSKILPISRGFPQQDTCLCWSYGFFSALETLSLVKDQNSTLELSRGAMQYINIKDRILEKINGIDDHISPDKFSDCWMEGGTVPDAANLIKKYGVFQYSDYHDIYSPPNYSDMVNRIFSDNNILEQYGLTESLLSEYFEQNLPTFTYHDGKYITAHEFGALLAGSGSWVSYAISSDGTDYQAKDPDPDARVGSITNFTSEENVLNIILDNLENDSPVLYGNDYHLTFIFGVDYDESNKPISFHVKDSYERGGSYTYKADVKRLLNELGEITVYQE